MQSTTQRQTGKLITIGSKKERDRSKEEFVDRVTKSSESLSVISVSFTSRAKQRTKSDQKGKTKLR